MVNGMIKKKVVFVSLVEVFASVPFFEFQGLISKSSFVELDKK
jgi:hypothetical protein